MPDSNRDPDGARPEFEVAYYTKELGKALQREMLQKQLSRFSDSSPASSTQDSPDSASAQDSSGA